MNGSITDPTKQLWQAAVTLCSSIEPADYKRYRPSDHLPALPLPPLSNDAVQNWCLSLATRRVITLSTNALSRTPTSTEVLVPSSSRRMRAGKTSERPHKRTTSRSGFDKVLELLERRCP